MHQSKIEYIHNIQIVIFHAYLYVFLEYFFGIIYITLLIDIISKIIKGRNYVNGILL